MSEASAHYIPTREEMVDMLWKRANAEDTRDGDKAKLCRTISNLMGYNRPADFSDLDEQLKQLEAQRIAEPEEPLWYETAGDEPH